MTPDYDASLLHETLRHIVEEFGSDVLVSPQLRALTSDLYTGGQAGMRIVRRAIESHMGEQIMRLEGLDEADYRLRLANICQTFRDDNLLRGGVAEYVVDSFLYSLQWIDTPPTPPEEERGGGGGPVGELSFADEGEAGEYCGERNADGERSGFGVLRKGDTSYSGEWKLGMRHGVGLSVDAKGNRYAGEWKMNRERGMGVAVFADGSRYAGEWKNGHPHGHGMLVEPGGRVTMGLFEKGECVRVIDQNTD